MTRRVWSWAWTIGVTLLAGLAAPADASRNFTRASSHYLEVSAAVFTAAPGSLNCWVYLADNTNAQTVIAVKDTAGSSAEIFRCNAQGNAAGDPVRIVAGTSGLAGNCDTTAGYSLSTWTQLTCVFASSTSRTGYLNGANSCNNTTSVTPSSIDTTSIGRGNDIALNYVDGRIAECTAWNDDLTAGEVAELTNRVGVLVNRANRVSHWSILGNASPEPDIVGSNAMTVNSAAADALHPRLYRPGLRSELAGGMDGGLTGFSMGGASE